jgi:hypothetical protein
VSAGEHPRQRWLRRSGGHISSVERRAGAVPCEPCPCGSWDVVVRLWTSADALEGLSCGALRPKCRVCCPECRLWDRRFGRKAGVCGVRGGRTGRRGCGG